MKVKKEFELIYGKTGKILNVLPFGQSTLKAFVLPDDEVTYLHNLVKMHVRSKAAVANNLVEKFYTQCLPVYIDDYPLPGFVIRDGTPYVNIHAINATNISDITPADIYSMFVYSLTMMGFIKADAPLDKMEGDVAAYLFAVIMKFYGKKSGIVGSHEDMIPKLKYLVRLYVHSGMMGFPDDQISRRRIATSMYSTFDDMDLEYDFSSTEEFLKAINKNHIISISPNTFSNQIIRTGGVSSLPMFEDAVRFFATIFAGTVSGGRVFSGYWAKIMPKVFDTLYLRGLNHLNRSFK
jgi:hypothetical protein